MLLLDQSKLVDDSPKNSLLRCANWTRWNMALLTECNISIHVRSINMPLLSE